MKIHSAEQGTLEWLVARSGIPTASEFDQLLTPEFKLRTGEMPKTYLARKLAERWIGGPLPGFQTLDMEFGQIRESEAIPWFELETGIQVQRVGLVTTDDGLVGCSPDGLIGDASGIEVKCPQPQTHVKYVLAGTVPKDYVAQVHGAMHVTGRSSWRFLSYCRHLPPLLLEVQRDPEIQVAIGEALDGFRSDFDRAWARLCEINGGEPQRRQPVQPQSVAADAGDDIIP